MNDKTSGPVDPIAFGKQLWSAWSDLAKQQGAAGSGGMPNWQDGMQFWSSLAASPSPDANHAVEQMAEHGQRLMQMLQAVAARIAAGEAVRPADLAGDWQQVLGAGNPMFDTLRNIATDGARGWDQFAQGIEPGLAMLRGERAALLGLPAFGFTRERQERLQQILQAQDEYAQRLAAYTALLAEASRDGMQRFERKLAERSEPGRQIDSLRGLYDLWIDAAEEAYAEVAMSDAFRSVYGAMVNAQMRLKQGVQQEVDRQVGELGLPTRAELDGAHRKIHAMQRELRALRTLLRSRADAPAAAGAKTAAAPAAAATPAAKSTKKSAARGRAKAGDAAAATSRPAARKRSSRKEG